MPDDNRASFNLTIPKQVDRAAVCEALRLLGFAPDEVQHLNMEPSEIRATLGTVVGGSLVQLDVLLLVKD